MGHEKMPVMPANLPRIAAGKIELREPATVETGPA